jgi:Cu/Ag efflux protein CusF
MLLASGFAVSSPGDKRHPHAALNVTSLTNKAVKFTVPKEHFIVLKRGGVTAVMVDNEAVDVPGSDGRRKGYNGVASLTRGDKDSNLFHLTGLNFEHIHDGTLAVKRDLFEPRTSAMELRRIDDHTVELYQPPTPNWQLESCGRYHLLADGTPYQVLEFLDGRPGLKGKVEIVEGLVKQVDPGAGTLQVTAGPLGNRILEVAEDTQIAVDGRQATLADLQEGAKVKAAFESRDGKNVATRIEVVPAQ